MADPRIAAAVQSSASPIETAGAAFMLHEDTFAAAAAEGYEHPFQGYFAGRAGMLGDVSTEKVTEALFGFPQEVVAMFWEPGKALHGADGGSDRYQQQLAAWGEKHLGGVEGIERFAELGEKVIAKAPNAGPVFVGWAAKPRSSSPAAHAAQVLQVLRELRFEVHVADVRAAGIDPKEAALLNNPGTVPNRPEAGVPYASLFGWSEPWPDVSHLKAKREEIEELTNQKVAEIYAAALTPDEAEELAQISKRIAAVTCP